MILDTFTGRARSHSLGTALLRQQPPRIQTSNGAHCESDGRRSSGGRDGRAELCGRSAAAFPCARS